MLLGYNKYLMKSRYQEVIEEWSQKKLGQKLLVKSTSKLDEFSEI